MNLSTISWFLQTLNISCRYPKLEQLAGESYYHGDPKLFDINYGRLMMDNIKFVMQINWNVSLPHIFKNLAGMCMDGTSPKARGWCDLL